MLIVLGIPDMDHIEMHYQKRKKPQYCGSYTPSWPLLASCLSPPLFHTFLTFAFQGLFSILAYLGQAFNPLPTNPFNNGSIS